MDINEAGRLKGVILFAARGAQRLRAARIRLAQINSEVYTDDDSFFDEVVVQFRRLRGWMRYLFSIYTFESCQLVVVSAYS